MKILIPALLTALLAGCASTPPPVRPPARAPVPVVVKPRLPPPASGIEIDRSLMATGQSSRVKFVILHYTVSNLPSSIKILTQQSVSSHYLLTDEPEPRIYSLVDENRQSNHAGVSAWKNFTLLNGSSIGIEIVHPGFTETAAGRVWHPYPQAQIDRLIVLLKEIVARHQIPPENILGHVDIAPTRKQDPGPMFPWYQLAQHGLVLWPDEARVASARSVYDTQPPDIVWFQQRLAAFGYVLPVTGELDTLTRAAIIAFQMKYRPLSFDGTPDGHTAALLWALTPNFKEPPPAPAASRTFRVISPPAAPAIAPAPFTAPAQPAPQPAAAVIVPAPQPAPVVAPVRQAAPAASPQPAAPVGAPVTPAPAPATAPAVAPITAPAPAAVVPTVPAPATAPAPTPTPASTTAPAPASTTTPAPASTTTPASTTAPASMTAPAPAAPVSQPAPAQPPAVPVPPGT